MFNHPTITLDYHSHGDHGDATQHHTACLGFNLLVSRRRLSATFQGIILVQLVAARHCHCTAGVLPGYATVLLVYWAEQLDSAQLVVWQGHWMQNRHCLDATLAEQCKMCWGSATVELVLLLPRNWYCCCHCYYVLPMLLQTGHMLTPATLTTAQTGQMLPSTPADHCNCSTCKLAHKRLDGLLAQKAAAMSCS